ncbi:MAG: TolC family protein [Armatimonadetes bacterium]|nr:TolC family protein [Armatimonadota bacterium]
MRRIIGILLLAPAAALAAPQPPAFTADDAVKLAIRQNPRLSAAVRDVNAAGLGVRSARALVNPDLVFAPAITRGGSDEEFIAQQRLELNGTRSARTGVANAQLRRTQAEAVVALRDLVFETRSAYHELARAQELRSLAQDLLKSAEEFDRITGRQVELGTRPGIEQTQTGIEVTRARQQTALAESRVATALAALNTLLGRAPTEAVGPLPALAFTAEPVEREAALQTALAARAEITAQEAGREAFQQEARLARAEGRPDIAPQFRAESVTRGFQSGIGVAITLPLLDHGGRRNRIRQAEELARAQADRAEAARSQVRQEVESALARLQALEAVAKGYQQGVLEQTRRLLDASRTGFRTGATSIVALLEAQRTYRSVLTEYTNALVDHSIARAELERALGSVPADLLPAPTSGGRTTTR